LTNYSYGGFYEEEHGGLTILTINTLIYSVRHTPQPPQGEGLPEDPFGQLAWLRERLTRAAAEGRSVWIVGHIPPGIETYGYTELWHPAYLEAYRSLVETPGLAGAVACQLFAHVHADEFRLLPGARTGAGPILLAGAISPIYRNKPAFRMVEYDPATGHPLNYLVYYSEGFTESGQGPQGGAQQDTEVDTDVEDLLRWRLGYSAVQAYAPLRHGLEHAGALRSEPFWELEGRLEDAGAVWNTYAGWYKTQYISDLMYCGTHPQAGNENLTVRQACVSAYTCALQIMTQAEYDACKRTRAKVSMQSVATLSPIEAGDEQYELGRQAHWEALKAVGARA